jgi:endonuclease YncB( thermonuclease family)
MRSALRLQATAFPPILQPPIVLAAMAFGIPPVIRPRRLLQSRHERREMATARAVNSNQRSTCPSRSSVGAVAAAAAVALFALSSIGPSPIYARTSSEVVVRGSARVVDGDTLYIDNQRIRLKAMDAFETKQMCRTSRGEEYKCGVVAAERMTRLIGGRDVECTGKGRDQYGRLVGVCSVKGVDLNGKLVQEGALRVTVLVT